MTKKMSWRSAGPDLTYHGYIPEGPRPGDGYRIVRVKRLHGVMTQVPTQRRFDALADADRWVCSENAVLRQVAS